LAEKASPATAIVSVPSLSVQSGWQGITGLCRMAQSNCKKLGEGDEMLAAMSIGFMLAIWVIVLWGSSHFNNNIH
jgi:hypothetical protein